MQIHIGYIHGRFRQGTYTGALCGRIIQFLTGTEIVHCVVAADGAVLDPGRSGPVAYPAQVLARHPGLVELHSFATPYLDPAAILSWLHNYYQHQGRQSDLTRIWHWVWNTNHRIYDCVGVVEDALQSLTANAAYVRTAEQLRTITEPYADAVIRRSNFSAASLFRAAAGHQLAH